MDTLRSRQLRIAPDRINTCQFWFRLQGLNNGQTQTQLFGAAGNPGLRIIWYRVACCTTASESALLLAVNHDSGHNPDSESEGEAVLLASSIVIGLIGFLHIYILVLEMFLWDKPAGMRAFGQTQEAAAATKVLAANQGLYNGFLAAGLFWGLSLGANGTGVKVFFLCCVLVAGVYGAATASRKILFIQAVPAAIGLALLMLA